jgi:hypothetical protein
MTTRELRANPQIVKGQEGMEIRYEWGKVARRIQKSRENSALIVFLFGLGVLLLSIGLCTDVIGAGVGMVGGVGSWVAAFVAREYLDTAECEDDIEFDV